MTLGNSETPSMPQFFCCKTGGLDTVVMEVSSSINIPGYIIHLLVHQQCSF